MGLSTTYTKAETDYLLQQIDKKVAVGLKGIATQANAPTTYSESTHPNGLFERYIVNTPITSPNSWGNIAVTQAELNANTVFFNVTNGVVSKELSIKPVADPSKFTTWTATTFASGAQVVYNGKVYQSNAATVAGDVPGVSTKWVEILDYVSKDDNFLVNNLRINPISYIHPRGAAEYVSDGQLTGIDAAAVILAPQGKKILVKAVDAKIFGDSAFSGSMAIYKGTVSSVNPSNHTLVESQNIAVGKLNTDPNAFQRMVLTNDLILQPNEYLFFYVFKTTGALTMRRWTTDGGAEPLRTTVRYLLESTWRQGSPGFYAVPLLIYSDANDMSLLASKIEALTTSVALKADDDFLTINLPDKIDAVVGDTLQLFFRSIIPSVNPYNYNIVVSCSKGNQYNRYFEYTPVLGDVGTTTLTITVKNNSGKVLGTKTCNLVTKNTASPASLKTILTVGDSLTSSGVWTKEAQRRLTGTGGLPAGKGLTNIAFKGRKNDGGAVGWEGTGGWNWYNYTIQGGLAYVFTVSGITTVPAFGATYTNNGVTFTVSETNITAGSGTIRCTAVAGAPTASGTLTKAAGIGDNTVAFSAVTTESGNPFWNGSGLDFNNYVNLYMGGSVDVVYFLLSWNGLTPNRTDFASLITTAKILIDHIHTVKPAVKIKIMGLQLPSLNGGMGYAYGANGGYADVFGMVKTVLNLNKAYQDWANEPAYSSFVEFVNVASQFDSENNMPEADKAVNSRSVKTEKVGTNGVHPSTEGYYQIADVVYRNVIGTVV